MLALIRRLWSRDHSRLIFAYRDGARPRRADPLVAGRKLEAACPDYADLLAVVGADPPPDLVAAMTEPVAADLKRRKAEAVAKLTAAADAAFGLKPLSDSGGLTEVERFQVLADFFVFMGGLADQSRPFSTSQSRASPTTPPDSPTGSFVASGSTGPP